MRKLPKLDATQLRKLRLMASRGLKWDDIGLLLDRSPSSIQRDKQALKAYRTGRAEAKLQCGENLFSMSMQKKWPAVNIFQAKVMLGFREDGTTFDEAPAAARIVKIPGAHFGKVAADG